MVDNFEAKQKYLETEINIKEDQISDLNNIIKKWKLKALNYKEDYDEEFVKLMFDIPIDSLIKLKRDMRAEIDMLYDAKNQMIFANKLTAADYKIKYGIYSADKYRW